jgi:hypothetical protein
LADANELDYPSEVRKVGWQVLLLAARVLALVVVIVLHYGLNWMIQFVVPSGYELAEKLLKVVFFCCFSIVYVHQAVDMMVIFVPWFKSRQR